MSSQNKTISEIQLQMECSVEIGSQVRKDKKEKSQVPVLTCVKIINFLLKLCGNKFELQRQVAKWEL